MPYRNTRRKNNRTNRNKRNKRKSRKTQSGGSDPIPSHEGADAFSKLTTYTINDTNKRDAATYFTNLLGNVSKYEEINKLIKQKETGSLTTLKNQIINLYIKEITTVKFDDHLDKVIVKNDETTLAKLNKLLGGDLCSSDDGSSSDEKIEAHKYEGDPLIITDENEIPIPLTTVAEASGKIKALWGDTPTPGLDKLFPSTNKKEIDDATGVFKDRSSKNINEAAVLITSLYDWKIHNENVAEGEKDITEKFVPLHLGSNNLGIKIKPKLDSGVEYTDWFNGLGINETDKVQIKGIPKPNINKAEHVDDLEISKFEENIKDNLKTIEITLKITDGP